MNSGYYMPAPSILSTGYPLDRERSEKLWRIQWNPKECSKEDICACIFNNNNAMQQPVLVGDYDVNPPFPVFGDVDMEGSPYHNKSYDDMCDLNREMNPNPGHVNEDADGANIEVDEFQPIDAENP